MFGLGIPELLVILVFCVPVIFIVYLLRKSERNIKKQQGDLSSAIKLIKIGLLRASNKVIESSKNATGLKICPSCNVSQNATKEECPNCSYDLTDVEVHIRARSTPSLKEVVLTPLIYLFGPFTISFVLGVIIGFIGTGIGIPKEKAIIFAIFISAFIYAVVFFFIYLLMSIFLLKRYSGYFFSGSWKTNLYSHSKTGLKWSIPFIVVFGLTALIPKVRAEWLKHYLLIHELPLENVTITIVILISAGLLVATFLEELVFRGMIQQYIMKFVSPRKSVLITAGIFTIAHFGHFFIIPVSLGYVVSWFVGGIFTGFAFNKYNSCISSFIPHLVFNIKYIIIVPLMLTF